MSNQKEKNYDDCPVCSRPDANISACCSAPIISENICSRCREYAEPHEAVFSTLDYNTEPVKHSPSAPVAQVPYFRCRLCGEYFLEFELLEA